MITLIPSPIVSESYKADEAALQFHFSKLISLLFDVFQIGLYVLEF